MWGVTPIWEWPCPKCRSILGFDIGRRAILSIPLVILIILIVFWDKPLWPAWAVIAFSIGWAALYMLVRWWFDSVVVRRPSQAEGGSPVKPKI